MWKVITGAMNVGKKVEADTDVELFPSPPFPFSRVIIHPILYMYFLSQNNTYGFLIPHKLGVLVDMSHMYIVRKDSIFYGLET